jgi:hypothetical protein
MGWRSRSFIGSLTAAQPGLPGLRRSARAIHGRAFPRPRHRDAPPTSNFAPVDIAQGLPNVAITGAPPDGSACSFLLDTGFAGMARVERSAALRSGLLTPHTPYVPAPAYRATHRFTSFQIPASRLTVGGIDLTGKAASATRRAEAQTLLRRTREQLKPTGETRALAVSRSG